MSVLPPGLQQAPDGSQHPQTDPQNDSAPASGPNTQYGMDGLASLLKMEQNDTTMFALGSEVVNFGLDLSEGTSVLKTLASPWVETSRSDVEPYFTLPKAIHPSSIVPPPGPCDVKIQSFSDETLFYIFYMKPRDTLQEYAARELVSRNWRYHKDIQVWLTKDSQVEPVLISPDVERGVYIFFDPHNWTKIKKEFVLHYSSVQA